MPPQFLVIGHAVQDQTTDGDSHWRPGGAVVYAALLARNLGLRTSVLTSAGPDLRLDEVLPGVQCHVVTSATTTRMRNVYTREGRIQRLLARSNDLTLDALPDHWRDIPIALLGPVCGEVDDRLASAFPDSFLGVSAQGWLRVVGPEGRVNSRSPKEWDSADLLRRARVLFVSAEDIPSHTATEALDTWRRQVSIVAFTMGKEGAEIFLGDSRWRIPAFPAREVDPTGAGDVFAAAFLIRLWETEDAPEAARFAACAASFVVEAEGVSGVPDRGAIEARLRAHPEIRAS